MLRKLTRDDIYNLKSTASHPRYPAFTKAVLAVFGLKHPLPGGWIDGLVGKIIPESQYQEALSLRDELTPQQARRKLRREQARSSR
jgi:hypothetical protein